VGGGLGVGVVGRLGSGHGGGKWARGRVGPVLGVLRRGNGESGGEDVEVAMW
jgi:hypothetical protein